MPIQPPVDPEPRFIPLCAPEIAGNEWAYVKDCLDTGWVSSVGAYVDRFERAVAEAVGARFAVATSSGTAALHVALLVAGVEPDDEVLVSALTFIAPANAVRYVGAWPIFVDAEPRYWQMDVEAAVDFLDRSCVWRGGHLRNGETGRRVRALLPVHVLGHPVDMTPLVEAAERYGLAVVEDATEGLGARYLGRGVGRLGDLGCFSFNGNKLVTTGGGGMLVTDDEARARRARYLTTQAKDDPIEFVHGAIGYNYRLTNTQAALGVAQLERLEQHIAAKRSIAARYAAALAGLDGMTVMEEAPWAWSVYWMYTVLVAAEKVGTDSRMLLRELARRRIETRPLWQPLHLSPAHRWPGQRPCPVAERLHREALMLPCSVGLGVTDQERVIETLLDLHSGAGRGSRLPAETVPS